MNKTFIYLEKIEEKIQKNNSLKEKFKIIVEKILFNLQTYELQETLLILNEKYSNILNPLISIYMEVHKNDIDLSNDTKMKYKEYTVWDFLSESSNCNDIENKNLKFTIDSFILYLILVKSYVKSN